MEHGRRKRRRSNEPSPRSESPERQRRLPVRQDRSESPDSPERSERHESRDKYGRTTEERQSEEIRRLKRELKESKNKISDKDRQLKSYYELIKKKQLKLESMERTIYSSDKKVTELRSRLDSAEAENRDLEEDNYYLADFVQQVYTSRFEIEDNLNRADEKLGIEESKNRELKDRLKQIKDADTYTKTLEKEKRRTDYYRKKMLELALQAQTEKEEDTGVVEPWKVCEICDQKYSEEYDRTPRVLSCGHTLCTFCARHISEECFIRCPFDRIVTEMSYSNVSALPKNFVVLQM